MVISVIVITKGETLLQVTLDALARQTGVAVDREVVVVYHESDQAQVSRLSRLHPSVRWRRFQDVPGRERTIPHQRNTGLSEARGDVLVFIDAGCEPTDVWLAMLSRPLIAGEESLAAGLTLWSRAGDAIYDEISRQRYATQSYLDEAPTVNLAIRRAVVDRIGGFDETFDYGSDVDFSWRAIDAGYRIRAVGDAVVTHPEEGFRRQVRRSYRYGRARVALLKKHRMRAPSELRKQPVLVAYSLFILGLPVARRYPAYLLLLVLALMRNRHRRPVLAIVDHLSYALGGMRQLVGR